MNRFIQVGCLLTVLGIAAVLPLEAAETLGPDGKDVKALRDKAYAYLKSKQAQDGSFSAKFFGPGPTALVVAGLVRNGYQSDDPVVKKALAYLTTKVQKNGGIYEKRLANYTTCVGVMALVVRASARASGASSATNSALRTHRNSSLPRASPV